MDKAWGTLEAIVNEVWQMLQRGVTDADDPFHCPVLGTTGAQGPSLRTVILRRFLVPERLLVCHTDARSAKVRDISRSPTVSWLFYHPQRKIQLRLWGQARLHADDQFADAQWQATRITSRLNYCATEPPGTPIARPASGVPDFLLHKVPTLLESERGRQHFMAIACRIEAMDWLLLSALGNRRARFDWDAHGRHATWLIP